jgi:hypothetical protein
MTQILTHATTDYLFLDHNRQLYRKWIVGEPFLDSVITILDYNLTFQSLDVYLENGSMLRVFNVKELFYEPYAKEEDL